MNMRAVAELLPSLYFMTAIVIVLDCGHRHLRPAAMQLQIGQQFPCCFCDD